jgi:hypothetical protein
MSESMISINLQIHYLNIFSIGKRRIVIIPEVLPFVNRNIATGFVVDGYITGHIKQIYNDETDKN